MWQIARNSRCNIFCFPLFNNVCIFFHPVRSRLKPQASVEKPFFCTHCVSRSLARCIDLVRKNRRNLMQLSFFSFLVSLCILCGFESYRLVRNVIDLSARIKLCARCCSSSFHPFKSHWEKENIFASIKFNLLTFLTYVTFHFRSIFGFTNG